ncbi:MAG: cell division protein FtsA [bacterium]
MANKEEYYVGLDVGSSKISVVVGQPDEEGVLNIIGIGISKNTGLKKGVVSEVEETVSGVSEAIEMAEGVSGLQISSAMVNINGGHISSTNSRGVVAVAKADQEITSNDIIRAEDAAQAIQIPANKELLHVIPRFFSIDNGEPIKDPIKMSGVRLEVETHLIAVSSQAAKNITRCVTQAGVNVEDIIVSPLAAAKASLTKKQRELGCVMVDIGAATTGLTVFIDDSVLYTKVFPIGAASITNDIAIGLRTSVDVAEKIKIKYGNAVAADVSEASKIDLSAIDISEEGVVPTRHVAEIIQDRSEEIFRLILDELRKIKHDSLLPAGVVLTGGGAKLIGVEELAKSFFRLPVNIGKPHSLGGLTEKIYDPSFSTAIGLMLYSYEEKEAIGGPEWVKITIERVKKIFKIFLP